MRRLLILSASLFFGGVNVLNAASYVTKDALLKELFAVDYPVERREVRLSGHKKRAIETVVGHQLHEDFFIIYTGKTREEETAYGVIAAEPGKHGPIVFFVGINGRGMVVMIKILESTEIKGKKVRRKRFLDQFKGKSILDPLRIRKDVDAVTGATVSSAAATKAVRKALAVWSVIFGSTVPAGNTRSPP